MADFQLGPQGLLRLEWILCSVPDLLLSGVKHIFSLTTRNFSIHLSPAAQTLSTRAVCVLHGVYITTVPNTRVKRHPEKRVMYMFTDNDLIETLYHFLFSPVLPFFVPFSIRHTPLKKGGGGGEEDNYDRRFTPLHKGCICHKGGQ